MKKYLKYISLWYLIYIIGFYPIFAYSANANSWNLSPPTRSGATSLYTATKQTLSGLATSSATLIPTARAVGGMALRGALGLGVGLAVTMAIEALLPDNPTGTWTNNGYVYTPSGDPKKTSQWQYFHPEFNVCYSISTCNSAVNANPTYFNANCEIALNGLDLKCNLSFQRGRSYATFSRQQNSQYDPNYQQPAQQTLTYDQIGQKVIDMANAGNPTATEYVGTVSDTALDANPANQLVSFGSLVNQLETNALYPSNTQSTATTNTQASSVQTNASETQTTSQSETIQELPTFCSYATSLCDWLGWTRELPTDTPETAPPVVVPDIEATSNTSIFHVSASCPASRSYSYSMGGYTNSFEIDLSYFCSFAGLIRPFIISISYLSACFIIFTNRGGNE